MGHAPAEYCEDFKGLYVFWCMSGNEFLTKFLLIKNAEVSSKIILCAMPGSHSGEKEALQMI